MASIASLSRPSSPLASSAAADLVRHDDSRLSGGGGGGGLTYDVRANYGAVGDGVANDTTAIQDALDDAGAAGGGLVYLPSGTYSINRCLNVASNVTVAGDGMGATVIRGRSGLGSVDSNNGGYTMLGQEPDAEANITIRDLTVDGNYSATGIVKTSEFRENSSVVDFRGITNLNYLNLEVKNGWYWHLTCWNSTDVTVSGCRVIGPGTTGTYDQCDGIHLTGVTRAKVVNNFVDTGAGQDGDDGIAVHQFPGDPDCTDVVIADNIVRGGWNGSGIDLANADGVIQDINIHGNVIWGCNHEGIVTNWFGVYTGVTRNVTITNNIIRDCAVTIALGDIDDNDVTYTDFVVSGNVTVDSGTLAAGTYTTVNSSRIYIFSNTTNTGGITSLPSYLMPLIPTGHATGSGNAATWNTVASSGSNVRTLTATGAGTHTMAVPTGGVAGQVIRFRMLANVSGVSLTFNSSYRSSTGITKGPYAIPSGQYAIFAIEALTTSVWAITAVTVTAT